MITMGRVIEIPTGGKIIGRIIGTPVGGALTGRIITTPAGEWGAIRIGGITTGSRSNGPNSTTPAGEGIAGRTGRGTALETAAIRVREMTERLCGTSRKGRGRDRWRSPPRRSRKYR